MEEQNQPQPVSAQTASTSPVPIKQNNKLLITIAGLVFLLMAGGLVYLVYQNYQLQQELKQLKITIASKIESKPTPAGVPVEKNTITKINPNCESTFASKILQLNFGYDKCVWNLEEHLSGEPGVYSVVTATDKNSRKVLIKANSIGMGGNYPGCYKVKAVSLLENNIVRVQLSDNNSYYYLTEKNDYAVKDYSGEFGDKKFNEYFTFLNPEAFPDTNMCWRTTGVNPVKVLVPKGGDEANKDITISIADSVSPNEEFLQDTDNLSVSIYSGIDK